MPQALIRLGYAGAFLVSFLSSTLVPLTAEVALVPLLALGYSPWLLFGCSFAGSYLGRPAELRDRPLGLRVAQDGSC